MTNKSPYLYLSHDIFPVEFTHSTPFWATRKGGESRRRQRIPRDPIAHLEEWWENRSDSHWLSVRADEAGLFDDYW